MASMNAGIILSGQPVNVLSNYAQGMSAGNAMHGIQRQREIENLYKTQGAGIAAGDQNALNALAGFDPAAALGIQDKRLGMDQTRQSMEMQRNANARADEQLSMARDAAKRAAESHVAQMSDADRQREQEKIDRALAGATQINSPEQFDAYMESAGMPQFKGRFAEKDILIAQALGIKDALAMSAAPKPADEYQRYVREEQAAGRQPLSRIEYAQAKKGKGITFTSPDGTVVQIGGAGDQQGGIQPSSPASMIATIDGILSDPALDRSTGIYSPLQNVPGTPQRRFGARANQLEGQAFLQAFESLKGGGQITEIEGAKATQAIGRLDTAQSAADYRQALTELRDLLVQAEQRPLGWAEQQSAKPQDMPTISDEAGYNALPSGTVFIAPDGTQRRKP